VPAAGTAALAASRERYFGHHEQAGVRVDIPVLTTGHRLVVGAKDM